MASRGRPRPAKRAPAVWDGDGDDDDGDDRYDEGDVDDVDDDSGDDGDGVDDDDDDDDDDHGWGGRPEKTAPAVLENFRPG